MYVLNCCTIWLLVYLIQYCNSTIKSKSNSSDNRLGHMMTEKMKSDYSSRISEAPMVSESSIRKYTDMHKNKTEEHKFNPFSFNPKRRRPFKSTWNPQKNESYSVFKNTAERSLENYGLRRNFTKYVPSTGSDIERFHLERQNFERLLKTYETPKIPDFAADLEKLRHQRPTKKVELGFWPVLILTCVAICAIVRWFAYVVTNCTSIDEERNNELSQSEGNPRFDQRVTDASVVAITSPTSQEYRQSEPVIVSHQDLPQRPQPFDQELQQLREIRQRIDDEQSEVRREESDSQGLRQIRHLHELLTDNNNSGDIVVIAGIDLQRYFRSTIEANGGRAADSPPCYNELEPVRTDSSSEPPPPRYEDLNL